MRPAILLAALGAVTPIANAADAPPGSSVVEGITVTAQKLNVENLIDRKVYSLATDLQSSFGSVSDILAVIPSVDVDSDGIVTLRGDANVLILIDGKPSAQFAGASAGDVLQSIPATDIERVEILTTPPAQFKADGAAGVINIITRKKRPDGLSGSGRGSVGSGGRSVVGADLSLNSGAWSSSASAGYRQEYRHRLIQTDTITTDPVSGQPTDNRSTIDERIRRAVPTAELSSEYTLSAARSLKGTFGWADRGGLRTYTESNETLVPSGAVTGSAQRLSNGHDPETDIDAELDFVQKLARPGETLDISLSRSSSEQHEHYDYTNDGFIPPAAATYNNLDFRNRYADGELAVDYVLPVSKTRTVKLGLDLEQDDFRFDNVGAMVDAATGIQTVDPGLTNEFNYRQRIYAAYASYQTGVGDWTWLWGLRTELTQTDADQLTDDSRTSHDYFQGFPSLHLDRGLSDHSTLSLGASRRISRPDPGNLNPYIDHEYTPNLRGGNPGLRPQYTQSYEVGYDYTSAGINLALTAYDRLNRDSVTDVTQYLGNGLSLTTKANLAKNDSLGLEFSANGHATAKFGYSISGNLFHNEIDASALGRSGLQSTNGVNAKVKFDYRLTAADSLQFSATRTDKRLTPQGYLSAINLVNGGAKHQLRPSLAAVATVTDLFNGQRLQRTATTPIFTQEYRRSVQGRILYIGLVYTFGSTKKQKPGKFEEDQANKD